MALLRTAVLYALVTGLSLFAGHLLHVDLGGLWVVLSALTILKVSLSDTLTTARDQLIGVAVGVTFGAVCGLLHPAIVSVALAVFLTALVCSLPNLRRIVNVACTAAAIVILLPIGRQPYVNAGHRFIDTVIGAVTAIAVAAAASYAAKGKREPQF